MVKSIKSQNFSSNAGPSLLNAQRVQKTISALNLHLIINTDIYRRKKIFVIAKYVKIVPTAALAPNRHSWDFHTKVMQ